MSYAIDRLEYAVAEKVGLLDVPWTNYPPTYCGMTAACPCGRGALLRRFNMGQGHLPLLIGQCNCGRCYWTLENQDADFP